MKITTIGKGAIGGGLAGRWERASHDVTALGREGGDRVWARRVRPGQRPNCTPSGVPP